MVTNREIRVLQLAVLDAYKEFAKLCAENGLTYYVCGGCLIGAVRHKGFIPWDDDMDIVMPINDYQNLIRILSEDKTFPYVVNHYLFENYDTGSYLLKICNPKVKYGKNNGSKTIVYNAFLSIFPLCGLPKNKFGIVIFEKRVQLRYLYLRFVRSTHNGIDTQQHNKIEKIGIQINRILHIGKNVSVREAAKKLDTFLQKYDYYTSDCICEYSYGIAPFCWKRSLYGIPKYIQFEDIDIPVANHYEDCLKMQYGDYMKLPPKEKQVPKHIDFVIEE